MLFKKKCRGCVEAVLRRFCKQFFDCRQTTGNLEHVEKNVKSWQILSKRCTKKQNRCFFLQNWRREGEREREME